MNSDLVQAQLILLLSRQKERLSHRRLRPEIFAPPYDTIYSALRTLFIDGQEPTLTAVSMLPGLSEQVLVTLERLKGYGEPEISMDYALDWLDEKFRRTTFSNIIRDAYDRCNDHNIPIASTVSSVMSQAAQLSSTGSAYLQYGSNLQGVEQAIQWRAANPGVLRGPSTGFMRLDRRTNGFTSRFSIIGARPSVGKSALIGNFIEAECEIGNKCLLFAAEMEADEYRERLLAQLSGVSLSNYRQTPLSEIEMREIFKAQRKLKKWKWWINDNPDISIDEIEAQATAHVNEHGRVHIFVDYLQLIGINSKAPRFERLGEISARLKKLQRRLKCPLTAAVALRRQDSYFDTVLKRTVNPEPRLEDIRESGNIEQDADMALLLHRDILNDPEHAKIIIAKQRGGSTDNGIDFDYLPSTTRFKESVK